MHRISDNRMSGSVMKNLEIFTSLLGQEALSNVVIATTMWSEVRLEAGIRKEEELKRTYWHDLLDGGCRTERFDNTYQSAWHIVGSLTKKDRVCVLLQREIVDIQLRLNETQAGITLNKKLERLIKDRQQATRILREQANKQGNALVLQELNAQKAQIDERIQQTSGQLRQLKIPLTRRFVMFIKSWSY
jgi:chromosome condensin MukBEF ATPase and DNA-binding subunit MukB